MTHLGPLLRTSLACLLFAGCSGAEIAASPDDGGAITADSGTTVSDAAAPDSETSSDASGDASVGNLPGKHLHELTVDGMKRALIVYVPEKARGDTHVPVVFMLHGTSGDGEKFFDISRWKEKSDAEGFISVFPSSLTYCLKEDENRDGDFDDPGERTVTTKWAAGNLGNPTRMPLCTPEELAQLTSENRALADHPLADDVAFFRRMLDLFGTSYSVDRKRVYASGFSNGAQMSARLGVELADRFAATASHAGQMAVEPKPPARPITMVFTVGNIDDRFTPSGTPIPIAASTATTTLFQTITSPFLAAGALASTYTFDQPRAGLARWAYTTSTTGAKNRFVAVLIEKCSHEYPNGTNHPMVMADALWEIFKGESLP